MREHLSHLLELEKELELLEQEKEWQLGNQQHQALMKALQPGVEQPSDIGVTIALTQLEKEIMQKKELFQQEYQEVSGWIASLEHPLQRTLLRYRYLSGYSWEEISIIFHQEEFPPFYVPEHEAPVLLYS